MESSNGTYCGIGALVSQNVKTGVITIVKPFVNGPAYEAGMLPGDIIYKVEGKEVTGVDISQVVSCFIIFFCDFSHIVSINQPFYIIDLFIEFTFWFWLIRCVI